MRRGGRILLVLVVVIVILIGAALLLLRGSFGGGTSLTPTTQLVQIVIVGQPINRNDQIAAASLSTESLPKSLVTQEMITDPNLVIGKYAVIPLKQGWPISLDMVSDRAGAITVGNETARLIQPGLVAISVPINRLDSVAYGIRDGDHVNVIATTLFVDVDANYQTILPDSLGTINGPGDPKNLQVLTAGGTGPEGRVELDPTLNQAVYLVPSETLQRPRLVSQMVLQDIQVLHVGTFALGSDVTGPVATPVPGGGPPTPTPVIVAKPDMITLIVTPQDAVSLTYMVYSGVQLTLTLRAPDDQTRAETEAATLQYLLSQYAIPVPAKLPYAMQPRLDQLPVFIDITPTPQR